MTLVSRHALATTYRGKEAADLAGISYRQLDYWVRVGALTPEVEAQGSGSRRRFTLDQVVVLAVGGALVRCGHRDHIAAVKTLGRSELAATQDRAYLGPLAHWALDPGVFRAMDAETVVLVDLARIRARVAEAADALVVHRSGRDDLEASR